MIEWLKRVTALIRELIRIRDPVTQTFILNLVVAALLFFIVWRGDHLLSLWILNCQ